jgi:hypothetical protein
MEANPGEQKSVAVHEEIPKVEAAVKTGAMRKWHRGWNLAAESQMNGPKEVVDLGRSWQPPAEE